MFTLVAAFYILMNAIAMRVAGGGAAEILPTTFLARIVPTGVVAYVSSLVMNLDGTDIVVLWFLLFGAKIFAINPYSQIAINGDTVNIGQRHFAPSDWIMDKLKMPHDTWEDAKIWGLVATAARTSLWAAPIAYVALATGNIVGLLAIFLAPAMALGYSLSGFIPAKDQRILAEVFAGAILGVGLLLAGF